MSAGVAVKSAISIREIGVPELSLPTECKLVALGKLDTRPPSLGLVTAGVFVTQIAFGGGTPRRARGEQVVDLRPRAVGGRDDGLDAGGVNGADPLGLIELARLIGTAAVGLDVFRASAVC